jgi:phosphocarrier protein FPr
MTALVLAAPVAGWATGLEEVPDPAFAQGLVGDGVAIDPTSNVLCAPCAGVVVSVHRARHACTLRADGGAEILLHIGIDTVELRGEGFQPLVADGQRVRAGEPLIRFDLDLLARRARSLQTLVLLVGGEGLAVIERVQDREVAVGDMLLAIARTGPAPASGERTAPAPASGERTASGAQAATAERRVRLAIAHGLHARPAAAIASRARQHAGAVTVACRERSANARSMASLLMLDARLGDDLTITASGPDAEATVNALASVVADGADRADRIDAALDRAGPPADPRSRTAAAGPRPEPARDRASPRADAPERRTSTAAFAAGQEVVLDGRAIAAGIAIGRAVRLDDAGSAPVPPRDGEGAAIERTRLAAALADLRRELAQTIAGAEARGAPAAAGIFGAQLGLLEDPELAGAAEREIAAGRSAAWAWRTALHQLATALRGLGNPVLAERTGDLVDLERRTLALLGGTSASRVPRALPPDTVLVADELLPSELSAVPAGQLAGLCTARGGPTSHVAILAAALRVPAVAIGDAALRVPDGAPIVVDGDRGQVHVFPAAATRDAAARAITGAAARRSATLAAARQDARTSDGTAIAVHANLGQVSEAAGALECGAEGCGLLRTELVFAGRASAPSEDDQAARYQEIADALRGRPLTIRTLDAGGDKPLAYVPHPPEANPALGVRGVRLALRHPGLLRAQLRAILRVVPAGPAGACRIMIPMIATLAELRAVRAMLEDERRALGAAPVALGAMIEVPAAALIADKLAGDAEFFSIGTNDLAQYALAMDRTSGDVAAGLDCLHPGVLRLIASTVRGAATHGRPVSVCGGAAADPCAVPIFVGLGVRTLSVAPAVIPEIKAVIRTLSLSRCLDVAAQALELDSGEAVRALVASTWPGLAAHHD